MFLFLFRRILHILRLLQVSSPEEILSQIKEIHPNKNDSWTYEGYSYTCSISIVFFCSSFQ